MLLKIKSMCNIQSLHYLQIIFDKCVVFANKCAIFANKCAARKVDLDAEDMVAVHLTIIFG